MSPDRRDNLVQFGRWLASVVARLLTWLLAAVGAIWVRLGPRARIAVVLATLLVLAAQTNSIAPTVSAAAQGLAVLLVALLGLWMIVSGPLQARRPH